MVNMVRPLAIYLPQFHPIPENDAAWGDGFTEWTNVKKAVPLFDGHYQPHEPHDSIGYYDLSNPEVLVKQAAMAKEHGIYGFAFYHYWFNGKRLLNKPIDNMLELGKPDFPFCFIWANENWTKRWDGKDKEIIIKQNYSFEDDKQHIQFLCENVFNDKRYITIDGKPVFIVYRTELFPDIKQTAQIWREEAKKYGFVDIYLIRVENFIAGIDPKDIGFDAAMEFAPNGKDSIPSEIYVSSNVYLNILDYSNTIINMINKEIDYKCFRTVFASWDNTPRRKINSIAFNNIHPLAFEYFLKRTIEYTIKNLDSQERLLFINAWNEWGEGCHIEPDKLNGFKHLESCRKLLKSNTANLSDPERYTQFLEQTISSLTQKYNHNKLIDYKVGKLVLSPLRFIKHLCQKFQ